VVTAVAGVNCFTTEGQVEESKCNEVEAVTEEFDDWGLAEVKTRQKRR